MPDRTDTKERYEKTALTAMRVARATGYIDWSMQPSLFKHYPDALYSYDLDAHESLKLVALSRCVTSERQVGGKPYLQLNTPSAGNLHPLELYVQIRGLEGIISGIYHVDAQRNRIVLIKEVERDGLEATLGMEGRFKGVLFVLSCVPFRSAWKYGERSWRYCFLDAGHQLGSIQAAAAACGQYVTLLSGFDAECLDAAMGFDAQEQCVAVAMIGETTSRACDPIKRPLMRVQPTDYYEEDARVSLPFGREALGGSALSEMPESLGGLEELISTRRSARSFDGTPLAEENLEWLLHFVSQPPQPLVCHTLVLRGEVLEPGLYTGGRLVRGGNFTNEITTLLVDQPFVSTSSLVLIVGASAFGAGTLITAGAFAHILHLLSHARRLGFSPVGAFLDRKLQHFLETDDYMLYALVIGNNPRQTT